MRILLFALIAATAVSLDICGIACSQTNATSAEITVGSQWWFKPGVMIDGIRGEWLKITRVGADQYEFELSNGETNHLRHVWFAGAVDRGDLVPYDPVLRAREDSARAATAATKTRDARIASIKAKKWPLHIEKSVIDRKVQIGMKTDQVVMAWGKPERINRTVGSWGANEQWIYGTTYLYFDEGILKSFQDSR